MKHTLRRTIHFLSINHYTFCLDIRECEAAPVWDLRNFYAPFKHF